MERQEKTQSDTICTLFGYRRIVWKINNYLSTCGYEWTIRSSEFSIHCPHLTKWRLSLRPTYYKGNNSVATYLERLECDEFVDKVKVNYMLWYPINDSRGMMTSATTTFTKSCAVTAKIHGTEVFKDLLSNGRSDEFTIQCYMIVYREEDEQLLENSKDVGLMSLSEDLSKLYESKIYADISLYNDDSLIANVHKAIVCSRNDAFKTLIEDKRVVDLKYPSDNFAAVEAIIGFLYTGDVKYVLRRPSFEIEKSIAYFNIEELKEYYTPDKLATETQADIWETQFVWTISNLDKITKGCLLSHRMRAATNDEILRLALFPAGINGTEDTMSLQAEFENGKQPVNLCVTIGILDTNNTLWKVKCLKWSPDQHSKIFFKNFICRYVLKHVMFVSNGNFKLYIKFRKCIFKNFEPVVERESCPIRTVNKDKHYKILSKQITSLFESGDYSDYCILSGQRRFQVHKNVISCRSSVFSRMVIESTDKHSLLMTEPDILSTVFYFIYSGVLKKQCKPDEIIKVYDVANTFRIHALKNACFDILQENFDVGNASKVLVVADKHRDEKLKRAAFRFICCNIGSIETTENWNSLITENFSLYREWTEFKNSQECGNLV